MKQDTQKQKVGKKRLGLQFLLIQKEEKSAQRKKRAKTNSVLFPQQLANHRTRST